MRLDGAVIFQTHTKWAPHGQLCRIKYFVTVDWSIFFVSLKFTSFTRTTEHLQSLKIVVTYFCQDERTTAYNFFPSKRNRMGSWLQDMSFFQCGWNPLKGSGAPEESYSISSDEFHRAARYRPGFSSRRSRARSNVSRRTSKSRRSKVSKKSMRSRASRRSNATSKKSHNAWMTKRRAFSPVSSLEENDDPQSFRRHRRSYRLKNSFDTLQSICDQDSCRYRDQPVHEMSTKYSDNSSAGLDIPFEILVPNHQDDHNFSHPSTNSNQLVVSQTNFGHSEYHNDDSRSMGQAYTNPTSSRRSKTPISGVDFNKFPTTGSSSSRLNKRSEDDSRDNVMRDPGKMPPHIAPYQKIPKKPNKAWRPFTRKRKEASFILEPSPLKPVARHTSHLKPAYQALSSSSSSLMVGKRNFKNSIDHTHGPGREPYSNDMHHSSSRVNPRSEYEYIPKLKSSSSSNIVGGHYQGFYM